jgi:hypothetical protein
MRRVGFVVLASLVLLTGCAGSGEGEAGFGVPTQPSDASVAGPRTDIRGTVRVAENGCLLLEPDGGGRRWIVWPAGQEADQGQPVVAGRLVRDGDVLRGRGALGTGDALPGWADPNSYFGSYGAFCSADETGVVLLDDVVLD